MITAEVKKIIPVLHQAPRRKAYEIMEIQLHAF